MITLSPKLIGQNPNDNTLTRYRQATGITIKVNNTQNFIKIDYREYDQTINGTICNEKPRYYTTTDLVAVKDERGNEVVAEAGHFTAWANTDLSAGLGAGATLKGLFETSINNVLAAIPNV